jgi:hypothetical protein
LEPFVGPAVFASVAVPSIAPQQGSRPEAELVSAFFVFSCRNIFDGTGASGTFFAQQRFSASSNAISRPPQWRWSLGTGRLVPLWCEAALPFTFGGGGLRMGDWAMGRSVLLWLLGVPIPIIILIALFWH